MATIIYCSECTHCFKNNRSKTGYSCEVWGHEDFACDTKPTGFCHKAVSLDKSDIPDDIVLFSSLEDAESVRDNLIKIAHNYGVALVTDLKELAGVTSTYEETKFGWIGEAANAEIRQAGSSGPWYINLPEPTRID